MFVPRAGVESVPPDHPPPRLVQMLGEHRGILGGTGRQAILQKIDRLARPIGLERNQPQIAPLMIRAWLQQGETMLDDPRCRPVGLSRVDGFEIIEHANHDRPGTDRLEECFGSAAGKADRLAEAVHALVVGQNTATGKGIDKERPIDCFETRQKMTRRANARFMAAAAPRGQSGARPRYGVFLACLARIALTRVSISAASAPRPVSRSKAVYLSSVVAT